MQRVLLIAALFVGNLCSLGVSQDFNQRPYVGRVAIEMGNVDVAYGSFSIIDEDLAITCHHVIRSTIKNKRETIRLEFKSGEQRSAKVIKSDDNFDLALLQFEGAVKDHRVGLGSWSDVSTVAGFKHGSKYLEVTGSYLFGVGGTDKKPCVTRDGEPAMYVIQGTVYPGMSGGPAIGQDGYLSGVVWGSLDNQAYITGVEAVYEFLEGTPIQVPVFQKR
jgi:S1-C subfamily serine protease